jgi:tetratricopeptide (TPR) repeat protein
LVPETPDLAESGDVLRIQKRGRLTAVVVIELSILAGVVAGFIPATHSLTQKLAWTLGLAVVLIVIGVAAYRQPGTPPEQQADGPAQGQIVVGKIPHEPQVFMNRAAISELAAAAVSGQAAVVCAVTGLRGVGKTQIAAAYARQCVTERWSLVGWVDAESRDALLGGMARVAEAAGVADPEGDSAESARRLRDHLETRPGRGLLVFDNAADPDVLRPLLPAAGNTQLVMTSTNRAFTDWGLPVEVSEFTRQESVHYLTGRTGIDDVAGADSVAAELGDLPLALAQAAGVIHGRRWSYPRYLEELSRVPVEKLLGRTEGDDYPRPLAAALLLSVQAAEEADPDGLIALVLQVIAALSPSGVRRAHLQGLARAGGEAGSGDVDAALERCAAGSLLTWSVSGDAVIMHRLLGRVLRERDRAAGRWSATVTSALDLLEPQLFPERLAWARRAEGADLGFQIEALWDADVKSGAGQHELTVRLLEARSWTVRQLREATDLSRAIETGSRTLGDAARLLGSEHPGTLTARDDLAGAFEEAGLTSEAIPIYEQNLDDRLRILGAKDPDTLSSQDNLGNAYLSAGRLGEAIALFKQALAGRLEVLSPDHPDTLASRNNLALGYEAAGQLDEATGLYELNLAESRRALEQDHPQILTAVNNLAYAYESARRLDEAIPLYEQALTDRIRVLGADHPDTLTSQNNLAYAYRSAGRLDEATRLHQQNLDDSLRVLGPDHPDTLISRNNLAGAYLSAARLDEAIALHEHNLAERTRLLGADHPHSLMSQHSLAHAYLTAGRLNDAIVLYEKNLADRTRVLDPDHPDTLTSQHVLAAAYEEAGRLDEAIALYEQNLADRTRVLDPDHPAILTSQHSLEAAQEKSRRTDETPEGG